MDLMYAIINMGGMYICFACCMIVAAQRPSYGQKYLLMTNVCAFIITVGDALEFFAKTQEAALVATKMAYVGKMHIMLFALLFVTGFTQVGMNKKIAWALELYNTILLAAVMTCENHSLFYASISYKLLPGGRYVLELEKGILFYAWAAEMLVGICGYCFIALKGGVLKGSKESKLRGTLIFMAALLPIVLLLIYMAGFFPDFDPTTLATTIMSVCFLVAIKRYGLLDAVQLAQERVLEDTKDGLIIVDDKQDKILYMNPVAMTLLPQLKDDRKDEVIEKLFSRQENVLDQNDRHYEIRISKVTGRAHGRENVQAYIAWIFDMTFINQYTSEMIKLKEASEQASIAKTNFLAHVSHEIRTPMNAIVGYSNMALRTQDTKDVNYYLRNIKEASNTLLDLINEILDISKIESGKMELVDVNYSFENMIHEISSMMGAQAGKAGLALIIEIEPDIPKWLCGDRVKLQEILTNLISNGIKYTKAGSVSLRIHMRGRTEEHVMLHIEVEDTGIGIERKNFPLVFGKFEQFDNKKNYQIEGSGLGLSIVKSFVEMMGGHITFESEYGRGTKFIADIWQGIGHREKTDDKDIVPDDENIQIQPGRILVVDDNDLNCDVAKGILCCLGMQAEAVRSARECITLLEEGQRYDIIFMDHMMPEMDGVEALHEIRSKGGEIAATPIVLLTANAVSGVKEQMIEEGFDDFLSKPIDISELRGVLIRYLGVYQS